MLIRYEKLVWRKEDYTDWDAAQKDLFEFLAGYPDDIWEKDWWFHGDAISASVQRIVPDAKDME